LEALKCHGLLGSFRKIHLFSHGPGQQESTIKVLAAWVPGIGCLLTVSTHGGEDKCWCLSFFSWGHHLYLMSLSPLTGPNSKSVHLGWTPTSSPSQDPTKLGSRNLLGENLGTYTTRAFRSFCVHTREPCFKIPYQQQTLS
jgi:hypothetical protein